MDVIVRIFVFIFMTKAFCSGEHQVNDNTDHLAKNFEEFRRKSAAIQRSLEDRISDLENQMLLLNKETLDQFSKINQASISNAIAFMSYESASREYMPGEVILFDTINLNIGESYSGESGKFTCPVSGLYFFSATGANPGSGELCLQIQIEDSTGENKRNETSSFGNSNHIHAQTSSAVIYCTADERVYVVNAWGYDAWVWATLEPSHQATVYQSSFKGFLIAMDYGNK